MNLYPGPEGGIVILLVLWFFIVFLPGLGRD